MSYTPQFKTLSLPKQIYDSKEYIFYKDFEISEKFLSYIQHAIVFRNDSEMFNSYGKNENFNWYNYAKIESNTNGMICEGYVYNSGEHFYDVYDLETKKYLNDSEKYVYVKYTNNIPDSYNNIHIYYYPSLIFLGGDQYFLAKRVDNWEDYYNQYKMYVWGIAIPFEVYKHFDTYEEAAVYQATILAFRDAVGSEITFSLNIPDMQYRYDGYSKYYPEIPLDNSPIILKIGENKYRYLVSGSVITKVNAKLKYSEANYMSPYSYKYQIYQKFEFQDSLVFDDPHWLYHASWVKTEETIEVLDRAWDYRSTEEKNVKGKLITSISNLSDYRENQKHEL